VTPRLPFLVVLALTLGGVAQITRGDLRQAEQATADALAAPAGGAGATAAVSTAQPVTADGSTWYCAGGETVVVANPTDREVKGRLTVYGGDVAAAPQTATPAARRTTGAGARHRSSARSAELVEESFTLPARNRRRFDLAELRQGEGLPAAVVELAGGGVVVEQEIDREGGSDVAPCTTVTAPEWHLAWGDTSRGARHLVVLFNPFRRDVTVDARFSVEGGVREPVRWQGLVVPARRVVAVDLGHDVSRRDQVSTTVQSRGGHIVVSRVQSFGEGSSAGGVSLAPAEPAAAGWWAFSHGQVDGRTRERIVLYNPGRKTADVEVALDGFGADEPRPQPFGVVVRPGGFEVVDYSEEDRVEPGVAHATVVRSRNGVPVVVERVLTFQGSSGETGGEVAAGPGTPLGATTWAFPALLPADGREARLAIWNGDRAHAAQVSVAIDRAGERSWPPDLHEVKVVPGGRVTLELADLPASASVVVIADRAVTAERILVRDHQVVALAPGIPIPSS